ncbi:MAG TPA: cellulose-binding domain-containing protein [Micromonosporaceae bacterium]|nr:cellulose-binding domain-containing protein [Micromonosporaceae bacterium]
MPLRALPSRRSTRIVGAMTVLAAATLVSGALILAPTAQAATACTVTYQPNEWAGGFTANIKLIAGDQPLSGWTVTWTYGGDQKVSNAWNAQVTMAGSAVTATDAGWNRQVAAGGSVEFGLQGTWSTANPTPTAFAVNGVSCGDTPAPPTTSVAPTTAHPTSAPPTDTPPTDTPPTNAPVTNSPPPSDPPTPTPPATPPAGGGCAGALICDGFENQTGAEVSGDWGVVRPNCAGTGTATPDSTVVRSGGRSIRINGGSGYCNHVFIQSKADLAAAGPVWYGRMYVRHTTALPVAHTTFVAMTDTADAGKDLRIGGQNSKLQWNRESDDAVLPAQSPNGLALSRELPTNTWNCLEFLVDSRAGTIRTWLGGTEVPGLTADGVPTMDIDSQWPSRPSRPALANLKLGWESYGSPSDPANTLWFDDVALGSTRIGC